MYLDYVFLSIDINKYGVTCGSKTPTCPVMWGHYGNNHTGVCLKFDFNLENDSKNILFDEKEKLELLNVNYSDTPLDIFNYTDSELLNLIFKIFQCKSKKWSYEEEIRLIKNQQGLVKMNKNSISQIIFGCKSSPKDRYTICKLIASLGYKINDLMIAKIQPDSYELKIEKMTIADIAGSGVFLEELNVKNPFA